MSKAVQARLEAPGPKRMLALDGGGVRGIITLAFLEHVERLLAKRSKNPEAFRLSDYFDLIGGTSVGSITAVLLAMGYKVSEVTEIFFEWIPEIFANPLMPVPGVLPRFDARKLTNRIRAIARRSSAGDRRSQDRLRRHGKAGRHWKSVDTDQQSQIGVLGGQAAHNRQSSLSLGGLIRASTAAPYYFSPKSIENSQECGNWRVRRRRRLPAQQPALQMFLLRQAEGLQVQLAPRRGQALLLISVGYRNLSRARDRTPCSNAMFLPCTPSTPCKVSSPTARTSTSRCCRCCRSRRRRWTINLEIDDQRDDLFFACGRVDHPLLSFTRYDVKLEKDWLSAKLGRNFSDRRLNQVRDFMDPTDLRTNYNLGHQAADYQVTADDFPGVFDI